MGQNIISEDFAKKTIWALFVVALMGTTLLFGSTRTKQAVAAPLSGPEHMQKQQAQLTKEIALTLELQQLEEDLAKAHAENATLESENQDLNSATLDLLDNFQLEYVGEYYTTAYCCEVYPHICGGNGVTASGTVPTPELTCAADWKVLPPGTWLYIEGVGLRRVEDSGSAIKGKRLDIAIDTHQNALRWPGLGSHRTWVLNMGEEPEE